MSARAASGMVTGVVQAGGGSEAVGAPLLAGLRVLDLTDERGAMCGSMFAELGADVIKVEPEGGSSRRVHPFLDGVPDADRSLYFIAYQAGKRSVTLNLESGAGQEVLGTWCASPISCWSLPVGYMEAGWATRPRRAQSAIHLLSVTPFGDRGPGAVQGRRHRQVGCGRHVPGRRRAGRRWR